MKCLFLTLRVFSATGGIEKVGKLVAKALSEILVPEDCLQVFSMYDRSEELDSRYTNNSVFKGFNNRKISFVIQSILKGSGSNIVILSHINLLGVGKMIKFLSPKTKIALFAHGIEVWKPIGGWKKKALQRIDYVFAVSNFTKGKVIAVHQVAPEKVKILNNSLDPFLHEPLARKDVRLLCKYGLRLDDKILFTLSRLSSHDREKGFEKVLTSLRDLRAIFPTLKYLIAGKYQMAEKQWLDDVIKSMDLTDAVVFTGYIKDDDLAAHFSIADIYIMPSTKEGFGIVLLEAMYYGKPVIAGNKDGSVDALDNGKFGILVDPTDQREVTDALKKVLTNTEAYLPNKKALLEKFSYTIYRRELQNLLNACILN